MANNIFSRYRQGENRVTATILAVFEQLGAEAVESLLSTAVEGGDQSLELIRYRNQPGGAGEGVPDAQIRGSFHLLFETKIAPGTVNREQLVRHLTAFDADPASVERLYVLSPDAVEPAVIDALDDRVRWMSFASLRLAMDDYINSEERVLGDRDIFLLRQLQDFIDEEGLATAPDNVVVVPARNAWNEYARFGIYICQPGRRFRNVEYLAFYRNKQIEAVVPRVIAVFDHVEMTRENAARLADGDANERSVAKLVTKLLDEGERTDGDTNKVFLLTQPEDSDTIHLGRPLTHESKSAWVQNQRYVSLDRLLEADTTADL